jgi:hypothetical protein
MDRKSASGLGPSQICHAKRAQLHDWTFVQVPESNLNKRQKRAKGETNKIFHRLWLGGMVSGVFPPRLFNISILRKHKRRYR